MNLNTNNLAIGNFMVKANLKAMFIGILIIATTFLVASNNANGPTAFAQQPSCPDIVTVDISGLPGQTDDASAYIQVSPAGDGSEHINIPGVGSANIEVAGVC